jgi:hypothetical protein
MLDSVVRMKTTLNILPFGQTAIKIRSGNKTDDEEVQKAIYTKPQTTEESFVEINFCGDNYSIPKTTGGIL